MSDQKQDAGEQCPYRKALEPFAKRADYFLFSVPDTTELVEYTDLGGYGGKAVFESPGSKRVTVGDFKIAREALSAPCPLEAERDRLRAVISNVASALFPNSPKESALAEFELDAMGACQVIRRLRTQSAALKGAVEALEIATRIAANVLVATQFVYDKSGKCIGTTHEVLPQLHAALSVAKEAL